MYMWGENVKFISKKFIYLIAIKLFKKVRIFDFLDIPFEKGGVTYENYYRADKFKGHRYKNHPNRTTHWEIRALSVFLSVIFFSKFFRRFTAFFVASRAVTRRKKFEKKMSTAKKKFSDKHKIMLKRISSKKDYVL